MYKIFISLIFLSSCGYASFPNEHINLKLDVESEQNVPKPEMPKAE